MGKKKKERQKRQSVLGQVKKIHQKTGEPKRGYAFQLIGAFFCDFFYYTGHILKWFVLTGLILTAAVSIVLFVRFGDDYRSFEKEADQIVENSKAEDFRMDEVTYIYGADGGQIAELSSGNGKSSYLNYRQIPKYAVDAFVAIEDRSYWRNIGIDIKGIVRVAMDFVLSSALRNLEFGPVSDMVPQTAWFEAEHLLALPAEAGRPFPLECLFCLGRLERVEGEVCVVYAFQEEEPVLPP